MELNVYNKNLYVQMLCNSDGVYYYDKKFDVSECTDVNVKQVVEFYRERINSGLPIQANWLYFILRETKFRVWIGKTTEEYTYIKVIMRRLGLKGCHTFYYDGGVINGFN